MRSNFRSYTVTFYFEILMILYSALHGVVAGDGILIVLFAHLQPKHYPRSYKVKSSILCIVHRHR